MGITFLTPYAAVFAAAAVVPLHVFVRRQLRGRRIRAALGLAHPPVWGRIPLALALALVPALVGVAAAQPVLERARTLPERTDVEAFVVIDTSRSMLASARSGARTRFERARAAAAELRRSFPEVPVGLASLESVALPYLFPTTSQAVFDATLADSLFLEATVTHDPAVTTSLGALAAVPRTNYFAPSAKSRVLVVFTDGETLPMDRRLARAFARRPPIRVLFVHLWEESERIYTTGAPEPGYRPDPASGDLLSQAASLVGGRVFGEDDLGRLRAAMRSHLGDGPTRPRMLEGQRVALMPYVTLGLLLPLALLLWRRNLSFARGAFKGGMAGA
jgi:hypothetical protein